MRISSAWPCISWEGLGRDDPSGACGALGLCQGPCRESEPGLEIRGWVRAALEQMGVTAEEETSFRESGLVAEPGHRVRE